MEAISHAGAAVGILASNGVVLAAEKKVTNKLLDTLKSSEKMYVIDQHISCAVAGILADANTLINQARLSAQKYRACFQEPIPVEQLVRELCDVKQSYTQYGGLRPFGVSFLFAGYDRHYGFQLYGLFLRTLSCVHCGTVLKSPLVSAGTNLIRLEIMAGGKLPRLARIVLVRSRFSSRSIRMAERQVLTAT